MSEGLGEWDDEPEAADAAQAAQDDAPELFYPNVAEFVANKCPDCIWTRQGVCRKVGSMIRGIGR